MLPARDTSGPVRRSVKRAYCSNGVLTGRSHAESVERAATVWHRLRPNGCWDGLLVAKVCSHRETSQQLHAQSERDVDPDVARGPYG
jgi:hypothetical protein